MRLESSGYDVAPAFNEEEGLRAIQEDHFDLSIVDLKLVQQDGIALMEKLHSIDPGLAVIILTAHGTIESAVEAIKKGAYTYLTKPFESRDLLVHVEKALENRRLNKEIPRLKGLLAERYDFANIVGRSRKMQQVLEAVSRVAQTDSTVYIYGESGTGKELVAKALHLTSTRKESPFVAINCAALPESLLESELFGHERGPSPEPCGVPQGCSFRRIGAHFSWMRWAICLCPSRPSSCAFWRNGSSTRWEARSS